MRPVWGRKGNLLYSKSSGLHVNHIKNTFTATTRLYLEIKLLIKEK